MTDAFTEAGAMSPAGAFRRVDEFHMAVNFYPSEEPEYIRNSYQQ
jgi:hypothetical protein